MKRAGKVKTHVAERFGHISKDFLTSLEKEAMDFCLFYMYQHSTDTAKEIAEHFGISYSRVTTAIYNSRRSPLIFTELLEAHLKNRIPLDTNKEELLTYGDLIQLFTNQFPGLNVDDFRPNGMNELYVWIKNSPTNLIATYDTKEKTFSIKTTYSDWALLSESEKDAMIRYSENDVKMTQACFENRKNFAASGCDAQVLDD